MVGLGQDPSLLAHPGPPSPYFLPAGPHPACPATGEKEVVTEPEGPRPSRQADGAPPAGAPPQPFLPCKRLVHTPQPGGLLPLEAGQWCLQSGGAWGWPRAMKASGEAQLG